MITPTRHCSLYSTHVGREGPRGQGPMPAGLELCPCQTAMSQTEPLNLASRTQGRQFWKLHRAASCERSGVEASLPVPSGPLPGASTRARNQSLLCTHEKRVFLCGKQQTHMPCEPPPTHTHGQLCKEVSLTQPSASSASRPLGWRSHNSRVLSVTCLCHK